MYFLLLVIVADSSSPKQVQGSHSTAPLLAVTAALFAPSGTVHSMLKRFSAHKGVSELIASSSSKGASEFLTTNPLPFYFPGTNMYYVSASLLSLQRIKCLRIGITTVATAAAAVTAVTSHWMKETCAAGLS